MRALVVALVAAIVALAAALRVGLVPAHHAMYLDEPWYAEAACQLVRGGQLALCAETWAGPVCEPYAKALGWPLLLAPLAAWHGCATTLGIALSRVLGIATVLLVAVACRCAGGGWWQGALAAAVLALHPVHVAWSATGETNVAAAAAELAGLCGALLYARRGHPAGAALAAVGLALSTAIRPEGLAAALACAAVLAAVAAAQSRRAVAGLIAAVAVLAALPGAPLWSMNAAISGGAFLSPRNFVANAATLLAPPGLWVHVAAALLVFVGAGRALRSPHRRAAWVLLAPALAGVMVAFAYDRFHERMLLGPTAAALPLVGFVVAVPARPWRLVAAGAGLLALAALWAEPLARASRPPETQLLETRIAARVGGLVLEPDALVVAEHPTVLRAAGVDRVMASAEALVDEPRLQQLIAQGRAVHFLCDMYCERDFRGAASPPACAAMLRRFAMTPVVEEAVPGRRYVLFRLTGPATADTPPPACPRALP